MQSRYARLHGDRQQQLASLRQNGWQILTYKHLPVVVAFKRPMKPGSSVFAKGWQGKADKPSFFFYHPEARQVEAATVRWVDQVREANRFKSDRVAEQLARRATLKASDHWAVGDVLYNSWGYDQTNIDWYQVVDLKPKSIVIRPVRKNYGEKAHLAGYSQPRRGDFCGELVVKPLADNGSVRFNQGAAAKWNGKPVYESHYH